MYDDFKKLVSIGNRKIAKNTMIFNISSATNCPCKDYCSFGVNKTCYAFKAERMYKAVLPYRERQHDYFMNTPTNEMKQDLITFLEKHPKIEYIRFNEAGDFDTWQDIVKLDMLANVAKRYNVIAYTYTHNIKALLDVYSVFGGITDLKINLSVPSDNPILAKHNRFLGVKSIQDKEIVCLGHGCMKDCFHCISNNGCTIHCAIH